MEPWIKFRWNECFNRLAIWGWHKFDWKCFIVNVQFPLSGALCWFSFVANHATHFWQLTKLTIQLFTMSCCVSFFNCSVWYKCVWLSREHILVWSWMCVCVFVSVMSEKHADERITGDFCRERKISAWGKKMEHGKWKNMAWVMTNSLFSYGLCAAL